MKATKITYALLPAIIGFFMLISGYIFLHSNLGTRALVSVIKKNYPEFDCEEFSGHLLGHLEITNLNYKNKALGVHIGKLTAHSSFNLLSFKLVFDNLTLQASTVTLPLSSSIQRENTFSYSLPIAIAAPHISLVDNRLMINRHLFQLPNLAAQFLATGKKITLNIAKQDDAVAFLKFIKTKQTILDIHLPIHQSKLTMHYQRSKHNFRLSGMVTDNNNGNIQIIGNGKNNNAVIAITAKDFHINHVWPSYWPAVINLDMHVLHSKKATLVKLNNLIGNLRGQSVIGDGELNVADNHAPKINFHLTSNNAKLAIAQNNYSQQLEWLIQIPDLHNFLPSTKGQIFASGSLSDLGLQPIIDGKFDFKNISNHSEELERCQGHFLFSSKPTDTKSYLEIKATHAKLHNFFIDFFELQASGFLKNHHISLHAKTKDQSINLGLTGKYEDLQWLATIDQCYLSNRQQRWQLAKPTLFTADKSGLYLEPITLANKDSNIALNGEYSFSKGLLGNLSAKHFDLSLLNFLLPYHYQLEGLMDIDAVADLQKHDRVRVTAQLQSGAISYPLNDQSQKNIITNGKFEASLNNYNLLTELELHFPEGHLSSHLQANHFNVHSQLQNQKMDGVTTFQISKIDYLEKLIPTIRNVKGHIDGHYRIGGTIAHPLIKGDLVLRNGSFQIPKLNLPVTNVNISVTSDHNLLLYKGQLTSGHGLLTLSGTSTQKILPLKISATGNNVLLCNKPEIKIFASPTMELIFSDKALQLSGKIFIPEANLHPHDFGSTESVSDDVVFINPKGEHITNNSLNIISSIQLVLGNKIYLNSRGIKGQVQGQLHIKDDPAKATVAYGQLWLQNGSYKIYGKTLQIDDGKLLFTGGPISNPALDIKASRTLQMRNNSLFNAEENIKVGVSVSGTLQDPKINLFSQPPGKDSADILSYLILGTPINSLNKSMNKSNTQLLLQAADALNMGGNNKVLNLKDKLKKSLGLEELDIGTQSEIDPSTQETIQHTAFVLGKYLSPRFYVNYSLDLFDHTNTLKVRYLLNKFWTVQSVANTNSSGVDILYTVEKD